MANLQDIEKIVYHKTKDGRTFEQYEIKCERCSTIVTIPKGRLKRFRYCSKKCVMDDLNPVSPRIKYNCQMCNTECESTPFQYGKSKNHFCSHECSDKYHSIIRTIYNKCNVCEEWFPVRKSMAHQICCSRKCQGVWQSRNLIGANANNYKKGIDELRIHKCDWCRKDRNLMPSDIKNKLTHGKKYFCSKECYREWYAKDWSQQTEWKEKSRERAVAMLSDGTFNKTDTSPQLILNNILDKLNINYENEYNCKVVSIDNYLNDYSLMIEVNGRYWHCDPRYYSEIGYQPQYDRVINDKRKNALIKSKYGIDILYLWEDDLVNHEDMCKALILEYVNTIGKLKNYHSFNYNNTDKHLKLNEELITPYSELSSNELQNIFIPVSGKKKSMRQPDKWTTFQCEVCGKDKEQLISHYIKSKTHCCSRECAQKNRTGKPRDFHKII